MEKRILLYIVKFFYKKIDNLTKNFFPLHSRFFKKSLFFENCFQYGQSSIKMERVSCKLYSLSILLKPKILYISVLKFFYLFIMLTVIVIVLINK